MSLCSLTDASCRFLASALTSSSLRELDLSYNHLSGAGLELVSAMLRDPRCSLQRVRCAALACCQSARPGSASALNAASPAAAQPGGTGSRLTKSLPCLISARNAAVPAGSEQLLSSVSSSAGAHPENRARPTPFLLPIADAAELSLDPNTAQTDLFLSEGNRKARRWAKQPYPDHPERFDFWAQVMSAEGLTGRCYWEAEWSGRAFIGAAYRSMSRKGSDEDSWLGKNRSSWGLNCTTDGFWAWHDGLQTALGAPPSSARRLGLFLDWSAGTLTFYMVAGGDLTSLHTFHSTFSEPVHAAFRLGWMDSSVCLG